jgi:hypothetical protein
MCDQISDAVLDAMLEQDPMSRVACETLTTTGMVLLAGEVTTKAEVDFPALGARRRCGSSGTRARRWASTPTPARSRSRSASSRPTSRRA